MRHRQRHVHATVVKYLRERLDELGWTSPPVNFSTTPITLLDYEPQEAGVTPADNTVAVSFGDQGATEPWELGGGLHSIRYAVFIDVYPQNEPIGIAIAEDVKESLVEEIIPVLDFTSSAQGTVTTEQIEFESVLVEILTSAATTLDKRSWRAVKATAVCYFGPTLAEEPEPEDPEDVTGQLGGTLPTPLGALAGVVTAPAEPEPVVTADLDGVLPEPDGALVGTVSTPDEPPDDPDAPGAPQLLVYGGIPYGG